MEVFRPLRNIWNRIGVLPPVAVSAAGVTWLSRFVYNYPHLMLLDLSPRAPATRNWPLYNYPPPHFLVGYEYMIRVFNDYVFDVRTYSRITYLETRRQGYQVLDWLCLPTSSYTIDMAAYRRFINEADFDHQFVRLQQNILADRIIADFNLQRREDVAGLGLPARREPIPPPLQEPMRHCQPSSWGFTHFCRLPPPAQPPEAEEQSAERAATLLTTLLQIRCAYFCFLVHALASSPDSTLPAELRASTPWSLPVNTQDWFSSWLRYYGEDRTNPRGALSRVPTKDILPLVLDALSLPRASPSLTPASLLTGGAVLRPRENGRAVTASMLRSRGEAVTNFIESLPFPTRRRRARTAPSPEPGPEEPF